MNKKEFDEYLRRTDGKINTLYCRIWNSREDGVDVAWLDVYFEDSEFTYVFGSDTFPEGSKELYKLQKYWKSKLKRWLEYHSDIKLVVDETNV